MKITDISQYISKKKHRTKADKIAALKTRLKEHHKNNCTIQDAEQLARGILSICEWDEEHGPVPIVKIAECFGIKVYSDSDVPDDVAGNIYIGGNTEQIYGYEKVIVVADNEDYFHQRFVAAHELGHYLMDYIGDNRYEDKEVLFSMAYPKTEHSPSHDSEEELRADRFAAELLMPHRLFCNQYRRVMNAAMNDKRYAIPYLSKYFEVKKKSIEKRILETKCEL